VQVKLYYPAQSVGINAPWESGTFPIISFGHGFGMFYTTYQNIWEYFVPKGYVIAMVDMENAIFPFPSHENFGLDIRFTAKELLSRSQQLISDPIYGKLSGKVAFMGHSMGGGSSVLGASHEPGFPDAVIGLSAAETNPSAVSAAQQVTIPFLMIAGEKDLVTPPPQHQIPIYNALASDCKFYAEIKGGIHCYYGLPDVACDFGETSSGSQPGISRAQQQQYTYDLALPFLEWHLKSQSSSPFFALLSDSRYFFNYNCLNTTTGLAQDSPMALVFYQGGFFYQGEKLGNLHIYDIHGKLINRYTVNGSAWLPVPENLNSSMVLAEFIGSDEKWIRKLMILKN